jgi:hypothetical protein
MNETTIRFTLIRLGCREYAAHVGDNLLAVTSRILSVQPIVTGLGDTGNVLQGGQISMKIMTEMAQDATQGGLMRSTLPWFCRLWANARICRELGGVDDAGTTGTQGRVL